MEEVDQMNGDTPVWVKVLYRYGVPAVIALGLTYTLTHDVSANVAAMRAEHQEIRFYLRAICINGAFSDADRARCVPPGETR
jgi:hypothetical protein